MGGNHRSTGFFCDDPLNLIRNCSQRGRRTDIAQLLATHNSYKEAVLACPDIVARGRGVVNDFYKFKDAATHRNRERRCFWICGCPGSGKSELARAFAEKISGNNYFIHQPGSLKWWDGYDGQSVVIINDLRRGDVFAAGGFNYLLNITDRYDVRVEVKGSTVLGNWDVCIITSPLLPDAEFTYQRDGEPVVEEHLGQLIRRLELIIELRVINGVVQEIDRTAALKRQYGIGIFDPLAESTLLGVKLHGARNE